AAAKRRGADRRGGRGNHRRAARLAGLGCRCRRGRCGGATACGRVSDPHCPPPLCRGRRGRRRHRRGRLMRGGVSALTRTTVGDGPPVCRGCVWWQSRGNKTASKERWTERAEEDFGEWGTIYLDEAGRFLGSLQYGPTHLFPRAADLPAGPASDDAVLVTCSYLVRDGVEWIETALRVDRVCA